MKAEFNSKNWKYLPCGEGKIYQMTYSGGGSRIKFTENPDNPVSEFLSFIENTRAFSVIVLPPCSKETINAAHKYFEKVIILDHSKERMDQLLKVYDGEIEFIYVDGTSSLRDSLSPYIQELSFGKVLSYIPARYSRLDSCLDDLLNKSLLEIQKEYCSFAVNRSYKRWHRGLNIIENIKNSTFSFRLNTDSSTDTVIVGAGPSLDDTVHKLKKVQDKCTIIATDGALRTLMNNGVIPDIIASHEDTVMSWQFFKDHIDKLSTVPLVANINSNHYLIKHYPGPVVLTQDSNSEAWLKGIADDLTRIESGRCVGHLAFNIAVYLNSDSIIMTGFDLAFKEECFHPRDMPVPYFHEMDLPAPETVLGKNGLNLKTDLSMITYLRDFEHMIRSTDIKVIDSTEGGALISGTNITPLDSITFIKKKASLKFSKINFNFFGLLTQKTKVDKNFKLEVTESFTSYLTQNSTNVTKQEKAKDLLSSERLLNALLQKSSYNKENSLLVKNDDTFDPLDYGLEDLLVSEHSELSDLITKVRKEQIKHIYCINGQISPDLIAVEELMCTDIKTKCEPIFNERVLWLKKYRVLCPVEHVEYWKSIVPKEVEVGTLKKVLEKVG